MFAILIRLVFNPSSQRISDFSRIERLRNKRSLKKKAVMKRVTNRIIEGTLGNEMMKFRLTAMIHHISVHCANLFSKKNSRQCNERQ